ncbi:MAG TPA: RNase adapter RapZ [Thermohalobaculum sp.]|nr:RNase adapter RapZ [Thermohalobaculum sp.]
MRSAGGAAGQEAGPRSGRMVVIVTGMSGAGRTTAINTLEDLGFEALNNFPPALVDRLLGPAEAEAGPIAIGVAARTRGFSARALAGLVDRLRHRQGIGALLVFLDCDDETLLSRFNETRRRHPMAPGEDVRTGIARERDILADVRARADMVIDTSTLSPHALRAEVAARLTPQVGAGLAVAVHSFSYKRGAPLEANMVLDCRFLRNPYWDETLRGLDGRDPAIQGFVREDPLFSDFFGKLCELLVMLLPAYKAEGKAYFCVALGCTGGRHRSVALGELLAARLREAGWPAIARHRELEFADGTPAGERGA